MLTCVTDTLDLLYKLYKWFRQCVGRLQLRFIPLHIEIQNVTEGVADRPYTSSSSVRILRCPAFSKQNTINWINLIHVAVSLMHGDWIFPIGTSFSAPHLWRQWAFFYPQRYHQTHRIKDKILFTFLEIKSSLLYNVCQKSNPRSLLNFWRSIYCGLSLHWQLETDRLQTTVLPPYGYNNPLRCFVRKIFNLSHCRVLFHHLVLNRCKTDIQIIVSDLRWVQITTVLDNQFSIF